MKYKKEGKFAEVLDNILTYGSLGKASAASNIDAWTIGRWRRMSEDGHEDFQTVEYRSVIQPFHFHVEDAIEQSIDEIESNLRACARDGYYVPAIWHGDFCYEKDDEVVAMDQATREMLGITDDFKWIINPTTGCKERKRIMIWIPPSIDAQVKVLSSWSDRYADKRSLKVDMTVSQSLGVTVMRDGPPRPLASPPPPQLQIIDSVIADPSGETTSEVVFAEVDDRRPVEVSQPADDPTAANLLTQEQQEILKRLRSQNPLARDLAEKAEANLNRRIASPGTSAGGMKVA